MERAVVQVQVVLQVLQVQVVLQVLREHQVLQERQVHQGLMGYHQVKYIFSMKVSIRTFQVIKN
jgi:hypothetical protein